MEKFVGVIIMVISTICYAALNPIAKKASAEIQPFTIMAITMFVLFILSLIGSIVFEQLFSVKPAVLKTHLAPLILFGVINFFGFWLLIHGFKYFPVWQQQLFLLLTPILGGIIAFFLLGESIEPKLFLSLAIIGVGLYIGLR